MSKNDFAVISPFSATAVAWFDEARTATDYADEQNKIHATELKKLWDDFVEITKQVSVPHGPHTRRCFSFFASHNPAECWLSSS